MLEAKLSSHNQIVIPQAARKALRLKPGDKILIVVREDRVLVLQKPRSHAAAIRGVGRSSYPEGYVEKERDGWESGN